MSKLLNRHGKWLRKQEPQLESTKMPTETSVLPAKDSPSTAILHHSCKTITLLQFIEVYCNSDFKQLIIQGEPTGQEINDAWQELIFEYAGSIHHEGSQATFLLSKEIGLKSHDVIYIEYALQLLPYRPEIHVIEELRRMGYVLSDEPTDEELDMINNLATRLAEDLEDLQAQYDRLNGMTSGKTQTEDEFYLTVAAISESMGFAIQVETTKLNVFVSYFNHFLGKLTRLKKQQDG